jgi:hypothetical protein
MVIGSGAVETLSKRTPQPNLAGNEAVLSEISIAAIDTTTVA